mgnify:CR=1 FL=1
MKYSFAFATLLFLLLYCKKPPVEEPATAQPDTKDTVAAVVFRDSFQMLYNYQPWNPETIRANKVKGKYGSYCSFASLRKVSRSIKEHFFISDIPLVKGVYQVERIVRAADINNGIPQSYLQYIVDEDQGIASYWIDTTRTDHYVEVLSIDTVKWNIMEGRFKVFMKLRSLAPGSINFPDTIACTEGYFKIQLK